MYLENRLGALTEPYVAMAVGIPGSGKTTLANRLSDGLGIVRVCPDDIRKELTGSALNQTVHEEVWEIANDRIAEAIGNGKSVILDATNTIPWRRHEAIKKYRQFGAPIVAGIVVATPLEVAKQRNLHRSEQVPEHVIERMHWDLIKHPVTRKDGFDVLLGYK